MTKAVLVAVVLSLALTSKAAAQEAKPTERPKCSAIPSKKFPPQPGALIKLGRVAACMPEADCSEKSDKARAGLGTSFCATNNYETCMAGTCDQATFSCQTEHRAKESKGVKLSQCVSRPSAIACPKAGEQICLCDVEVEPKGALACGCSCRLAPTPTPTAR